MNDSPPQTMTGLSKVLGMILGRAAQLVTLLFIAMRACDVIQWSLLWVLSPLWITLIIIVLLAIVLFLLSFLLGLSTYDVDKEDKT